MRLRTARKRGAIPRNITHEHYIRCDNTGLRILSGDSRKQWDNQIVWKGQFDERNPQEFVRGVVDNFAVMEARPESPDSVTLATATVTNQQITGTGLTLVSLDTGALNYLSFIQFNVTSLEIDTPVVLLFGNQVLVLGNNVLFSGTQFVTYNGSFGATGAQVFIETSTDNVTWTAVGDPLTQILIAQTQVGTQIQVPVGRSARYVRVRLVYPTAQTIRVSVTAAVFGGSTI